VSVIDPPLARRAPRDELTWLEHLSELRRRLLVALAALAGGTVVAWLAYNHILGFMIAPYHQYLLHHPRADISQGNLVATAPLEGFTTRLKVSGYVGIVLAAPVWIWQVWRFIAPGLYRHEKRLAAGFVGSTLALFAFGAATAVLIFPKAIGWMISVSGTGVAPLFSPGKYLGLYAAACVTFGLVFTYPAFLVGLEWLGVVSSKKLRHWRRYAIVLLCAAAAVITPSGDPFSFLAMAIPLVALYEGSILVGRVMHK
jgi:sec-independent protein translocase protein TatC